MRLIKAKLVNACQHESVELDFPLGITLIKGPNGAGKSNLIKMIKASLTGDFTSNPPPKEANIRSGIDKDVESYITTHWEHTGTKFDVTRALQAKKNCLNVEGLDSPIRKITEINNTLEGMLGISKRVVDEFIFVDQWKIFSFMSATPAVRAKTFSHLCNTERAERLWDVIGVQMKSDAELAAGVIDNSAEIKEALALRTAKLQAHREELVECEAACLKKTEGKAVKAIIADGAASIALALAVSQRIGQITSMTKTVAGLKVQLSELSDEFKLLQAGRVTMLATLKESKGERDELKAVLTVFDTNAKSYATLATVKPAEPEVDPDIAAELGQLADTRSELEIKRVDLKRYRDLIKSIESVDSAECPTCGSDLDSGSEHYQDILAQEAELSLAVEAGDQSVEELEEHESAVSAWNEAVSRWELSIEAAEGSIVEFSEEQTSLIAKVCPDDDSVEAQRAAVADLHVKYVEDIAYVSETFDTVYEDYDDKAEELSNLKINVGSVAGQLKTSEEDQEADEAALASLDVSPEEVEEAEAKLEAHREAKPKRNSIREFIEELEHLNEADEASLVALKAHKARTAIAKDWLADLEYYRSIFHRDALPKVMAQTAMESMVNAINNILVDDFDAPFYVTADDNLSFTVHKNDGTSESAERLSGGEKVILAVAFRLAVNSIFAGEVGMMVLDEPTAGLDTHNIDCLVDLFARLQESSKAKGRQIIVITHDERLERACDNVLTISKS